jgi:hypothetical protein
LLINKSITLRGAGASLTTLQKTNGAVVGSSTAVDASPIIVIGPTRWPTTVDSTSNNLSTDGAKGSYSVTLVNGSGFAAGQFVLVDADEYNNASWTSLPNRSAAPTAVKIWASDRTVFMRHSPAEAYIDDPFPDSLAWFSRANRPTAEIKEIASVNGNVVTFTVPLHISYPISKQSQVTRFGRSDVSWDGTFVKSAGAEDLKVTGGSDGAIRFMATAHSWLKNVENTAWLGEAVAIAHSYGIEIRDSYIHDAVWPYPGGAGYSISLQNGSSESLIENNIIMKANKMMVARSSGAGSVVGYNYADDGYVGYDLSWQEVGLNGSHMVGSHDMLFEGNESFNYDSDNTHGNAIYMTVFRNHLTGFRRDFAGLSNARTAGLMYGSWWHTFIGNVQGVSGGMGGWTYDKGIWKLGYDPSQWDQDPDPKVLSTTLRDGNFDYLTNSVHWDRVAQALPASLYLTSKPAFFGSNPWPWVDGSSSTTPLPGSLPARKRFDAGTPNNVQ